MKTKFYIKNSLSFFLLLLSSLSIAQPLSGTYTIGGVAPDYLTVGSAVNAIQFNGISGPVIFNIRDGQYNEKISLVQFAGSSQANNVIFQSENGDSSLVIISDSSSNIAGNNFTIDLIGADYINFNKITIQRPGSLANGTVVQMGNNSNGISFTNCQIIAGSGSSNSTSRCLIFSDSLNKNVDFVASDNIFINGNFGIYKQASGFEKRNRIVDNIFQNQFAGSIYVDRQDSLFINKNIITVNGSNNYNGITLRRCTNLCLTNKNRISATTGQSGLYYIGCYGVTGAENMASNNFISIGGTTANSGVLIQNTGNLRFFYNSISMNGTSLLSNGINISGNQNTSIQLQNNISANFGGGYAMNVADTSALSVSDYNDFYTTGANIGSVNLVNAALLADLQTLTNRDANSVSADPVYTSLSDLHASSVGINDKGVFLTAVGLDIDGDSRNATTPDLGADEFTPLNDNVLMKAILSPVDYDCGDADAFVTIIIQNLGLNNATAIPVTVEISGPTTATLNDTIFSTLASYDVDTFTFSSSWNTLAGGIYTLKCYASLPGDQNLDNDTLVNVFNLIAIPNIPVGISPQIFCAGDANLTATTDSGNVLFWYDQALGGNLIYTGDTLSLPLTTDTAFYVEAHSGTGSTGCLRISEIAPNDPTPYNADHIEIQNCSAAPVNVNGWVVAVSDSYTDINLVNPTIWNLSSLGTIAPGQIEFKTDGATNPWGINIFWNPGSPSWAIIIDNVGNVVDFVSWFYTDNDIQGFNTTINGFPITLGSNWNGAGFNTTCAGNTDTYTRIGNTDNDDATDFTCSPSSPGILNSGLNVPFSACGASACGSKRFTINVVINPLPVVNLGPDTTSALPVTFDAGAGFATYLWSNAATTQTISVSTTGPYFVVVTDTAGCSASDTVNYISTVGIDQINSLENLNIYPNPAHDIFTVSFSSGNAQTIKINLQNYLGETLMSETKSSFIGTYRKDFNVEKLSKGIYNLEIITNSGILNKKIVVK